LRATDGRSLPSADVRGADSGRARRAERTEGLEALVDLAAGVGTLPQRGRSSAHPDVADRERYGRAGSADELAASLARALAPGASADSPVLVRPGPARTSPSRRASRAEAGRAPHRGWRHSYRLGLLVILVIQAAEALRLVWTTTAFQDEAEYLWYGHMEWAHWLHGAPLPVFYLSGAPNVYPPLGAAVDSVAGLAGARLLSLCFMLGATALLYGTASRLFGRMAGLFAAAMFVAVGPTIDMSAWATYDPMAICLTALAAWLAVRAAGSSRASEAWIFLAAVVAVLADATKFVAALWSPVIVALAVLAAPVDWRLAVARGVRFTSYAVAVGVPALFLLGGQLSVTGVSATTTARGSGGDPRLEVLWKAVPTVAAVLAVALLALVLAWRERAGRRPLIISVLVVATLLAPVFQAYDETTTSQYKHVVFGLWFGAMAGGYALSKAAVVNPLKGWRVGLATAIFAGLLGYGQALYWYGWWPNTTPLMAAVEHRLPSDRPILMQGGDQMVAAYYLLHAGIQASVTSSYWYDPETISAMISQHELGMIEFNTGSTTSDSLVIKPGFLRKAGYRQIERIRWRDPNGDRGWFTIWQLKPGVG
jgi:hypothetical protein